MDSPHPPRPPPGTAPAGADLSREDRDLIAQYILLRALTRLERRSLAVPAPRRRAAARRRARRRP